MKAGFLRRANPACRFRNSLLQTGGPPPVSDLHVADVVGQPALVAGGLVGVNQALARHAINHRHRSLVLGFGFGLVAGINRLDHPLDVGAQHGAHTGVVLAMLFRLTGALLCLNGVGQNSKLLGNRRWG